MGVWMRIWLWYLVLACFLLAFALVFGGRSFTPKDFTLQKRRERVVTHDNVSNQLFI
jgi:hypothetical protein